VKKMADLELLSNRLLQLEGQYRRLKRIALVLCILLTAGTILAQTQPSPIRPPAGQELELRQLIRQETRPPVSQVVEDKIRAHQFILVDGDGKERASLVADAAGSVFLVLFDKNEKSRVNLSVSNDGPSLILHDPDGKPRTILGSTSLVASHVNEKGVMERTPASSIVLFDRAGKLLFRTP
jgi:hypothetical protein